MNKIHPVLNRFTLWLPVGLILILAILASLYFAVFHHHSLTVAGLVQAKESRNASRFGGRVKAVLVKEGDRVNQGEKLVEFDDMDIRAKVDAAKAQLEQAKAQEGMLTDGPDHSDIREAYAQVQQAQSDLKILTNGADKEEIAQAQARMDDAQAHYFVANAALENAQPMLKDGIISQQKYNSLQAQEESSKSELSAAQAALRLIQDGANREKINIARSRLNAAEAQYQKVLKGANPHQVKIASSNVEQAQSTLNDYESQLSEATITAPIPGIINVLNVNPGELVMPNRPVVSIIDDTHLWTDVYVPETQLDKIRVGQRVQVIAPVYKHSAFTGKVVAINPKSEFVPGNDGESGGEEASFRVKVAVSANDNNHRQQLHPGMRVNVTF